MGAVGFFIIFFSSTKKRGRKFLYLYFDVFSKGLSISIISRLAAFEKRAVKESPSAGNCAEP